MFKILIAEDDKNLRNIVVSTLKKENYTVSAAENGKAALDLFSAEKFDLVITDVMMPIMDGNEFCAELRKIAPDIPILMTGQGNERGAPETFIKEKTDMKYDPELAALLAQSWSNNACWGYVIYAMENCGFSPTDIRRVVAELHEVFDFCGLEEAQQHFENSPY